DLIAVEVVPHLDDLAVDHAKSAVAANVNVFSGRLDQAVTFSGVGAPGQPGDRHHVALNTHLLGNHLQVWRRRPPSFAFGHGFFKPLLAVIVMNNAVAAVNLVDQVVAATGKEVIKYLPYHSLVLLRLLRLVPALFWNSLLHCGLFLGCSRKGQSKQKHAERLRCSHGDLLAFDECGNYNPVKLQINPPFALGGLVWEWLERQLQAKLDL